MEEGKKMGRVGGWGVGEPCRTTHKHAAVRHTSKASTPGGGKKRNMKQERLAREERKEGRRRGRVREAHQLTV